MSPPPSPSNYAAPHPDLEKFSVNRESSPPPPDDVLSSGALDAGADDMDTSVEGSGPTSVPVSATALDVTSPLSTPVSGGPRSTGLPPSATLAGALTSDAVVAFTVGIRFSPVVAPAGSSSSRAGAFSSLRDKLRVTEASVPGTSDSALSSIFFSS
jgi:hypothetical protein